MTGDALIDEVLQRLIRSFDPIKIILFGSRARGDAGPDSDLDLLIVMPDGTDRHRVAVAMRREVADILLPMDLVVTTPQQVRDRGHIMSSVLHPALAEGTVLHERAA